MKNIFVWQVDGYQIWQNFFFYQNSVPIIGQVDVDKKAELEIKKIEM